MADENGPTGLTTSDAILVVVEVPKGSEKATVDQLIHSALQQVSTDALEDNKEVVVVTQHNGGS